MGSDMCIRGRSREAQGVACSGNAWSGLPLVQVPAGDGAIAAEALVDPLAEVETWDAFDVDNYRPRAGGPLVVDGRAIAGALAPAGVGPDEPDTAGALERLALAQMQLEALAAAGNVAAEAFRLIELELTIMAQRQRDAADNVAEAVALLEG